jgi:hypothetical protein
MRHYAALSFTHFSENGDEEHIIRLINDDIPLVRYSAATAGIIYGSEVAIDSIIIRMSKESWLTQTVYMQGFDKIPYSTHYYLVKIMKN